MISATHIRQLVGMYMASGIFRQAGRQYSKLELNYL